MEATNSLHHLVLGRGLEADTDAGVVLVHRCSATSEWRLVRAGRAWARERRRCHGENSTPPARYTLENLVA